MEKYGRCTQESLIVPNMYVNTQNRKCVTQILICVTQFLFYVKIKTNREACTTIPYLGARYIFANMLPKLFLLSNRS